MRSAILSAELSMETIGVGDSMGVTAAPVQARRHRLPGGLVVSLTSWAPRFPTLYLTVRSLLKQSVRPDRIVIWVADADVAQVPDNIRRLAPDVEIIACPDVGSYKKLVYCVGRFAGSYILTADDDIFYAPTWLQDFEESVVPGEKATLCHYSMRMHRVQSGALAEYSEWTYDPQDNYARQPSDDLLPVGVGGILYPPGSLHTDIDNASLFNTLAPWCDDFWFFAMSRLAGFRQKKVGRRFKIVVAPGTQACALSHDAKTFFYRNDQTIRRLEAHYGALVFSAS